MVDITHDMSSFLNVYNQY